VLNLIKTKKLKIMKNFIKFAAVALIVAAFTTNVNAQFRASAGLDLGMVTNEGAGLTYGLSVGAEFGLTDNLGVTATLGYSMVSMEEEDVSQTFMPYMAGVRYYFSDNEGGIYANAQVGMVTSKVTVDTPFGKFSGSSTDFSFAPGVGYLLNEHIDLGLRYQMILGDGDSVSWIAVRAAYNF
jgi:hypothetical protein